MSPNGLRARFRQKQSEPPTGIELGTASANAYFTSKRIRQRVPRKTKPAPRDERVAVVAQAAQQDGPAVHQDDQQLFLAQAQSGYDGIAQEKGHVRALQVPVPQQVIAELRARDNERVGASVSTRFEQHFATWKSEVLAGYNLLLYGVGSKLALLQNFAASCLSDSVVIQVHGYLSLVSLKYVVETIQEKILHLEAKPNQSLVRQCRDIALTRPSSSSQHVLQVYLIVHSIDGLALRHPETQTCLSWLAKAPFISLAASMDHINGPSIWKEEDFDRFEWLSQKLDTCEPYTDEIELRLTKRSKTADATSNGVKFILQSLTPTDVATLQELARQQLAASASTKRGSRKLKGMHAPYQSVYEACRRKLLHATPLAMKNSVKCLEDHGLLKQSRVNTVEYLEIPLSESIIRADILREETEGDSTYDDLNKRNA